MNWCWYILLMSLFIESDWSGGFSLRINNMGKQVTHGFYRKGTAPPP